MKSRKDLRVARERLDTRQHRLNRSEVELFAAGVAHEFNNVLGAALGHAEWALDSGDPEDMKDSLKTVVRACERAREITWALKGLAQPREERVGPINVKDLVQSIETWAAGFLKDDGVSFVIGKVPQATIEGDRDQLKEILINLIKNARDSLILNRIPQKTIWLKIIKDKSICFLISDSGPGVPVEFQESIFRPFFTTKGVLGHMAPGSANSPSGGIGLGLYMARNTAIEHGGDLTLGAKPSEFVLKIPLA